MQWTGSVGLALISRDRTLIKLQTPSGDHPPLDVLDTLSNGVPHTEILPRPRLFVLAS